ncbi:hypothetical protein [Geodermatophilus marinus]|uniref:hypothetical protein n=1 Tax=Geodermatophilus sp. LHW52908 TaxID=2303986 RepID=UPI000E3E0D4E|nr:hypothetical protein [Geodermatophilus sp. LHW52908]RFU21658.1 hypothetical protein D0Z06_10720 [Geodermatophilus sp. LHW52908]
MTAPAPGGDRCGVCVVRVWPHGDGVVIRVLSRTDVERWATEDRWTVADVDDALVLLRRFLVAAATVREPGPPLPR